MLEEKLISTLTSESKFKIFILVSQKDYMNSLVYKSLLYAVYKEWWQFKTK